MKDEIKKLKDKISKLESENKALNCWKEKELKRRNIANRVGMDMPIDDLKKDDQL